MLFRSSAHAAVFGTQAEQLFLEGMMQGSDLRKEISERVDAIQPVLVLEMLGRMRNEHISHITSDQHKKYVIRSLRKGETDLLKDFLYEAIFIPKGAEPPAWDIIEKPELRVYTDGFATQKGDNCLVADFGGKVVGAV